MDGQQTADGYRRMADEMNRWGETARTYGLHWYAHLHDNEFVTDPSTEPGGVRDGPVLDPARGRRRDRLSGPPPGSFPLFHLKDGTLTRGIETDLGEGTVDFVSILSRLRNLGAYEFVIERDEQPDPVRTANVSYDYLRSLRIPLP